MTYSPVPSAGPFWISVSLLPLVWLGAIMGGWWLALTPLITWYAFVGLDAILGVETANPDPETAESALNAHRAVTLIWAPLQATTLLWMLWYVPQAAHLSGWGKFWAFFGMGVQAGTIGINYAHELMHQKNRTERACADFLLAMVMYSHFRSEHLLVHHRYVGTPRDPVTARYNEGFHRFFPRVLHQSWFSAFRAEQAMLARKGLRWHDPSNPFFLYWALQAGFLLIAMVLGGWVGVGLFLVQAFVAIWQLELVNYIEHYGLTRKHLGEGRYEHVLPRHSWNAAQRASNWLLINLQRHSDHHYKPNRRFPLLQTYGDHDAPQLPFGYPTMTLIAMTPPLWKRVMNPRVRRWRKMYYPEINDWRPYNKARNPLPR